MSKDSDTKSHGWLEKLLRRIKGEEDPENSIEREQRTPVKYKTISINVNGVIEISVNQFGPNGIRACGDHEIKPGEEHYAEALRDYGYLKAGESHTTVEKLIDGKWILKESHCPDSHLIVE